MSICPEVAPLTNVCFCCKPLQASSLPTPTLHSCLILIPHLRQTRQMRTITPDFRNRRASVLSVNEGLNTYIDCNDTSTTTVSEA